MNKYLPPELRNLEQSKQRVIQNVEMTIQKKPKYIVPKVMTAILGVAVVAMLCIFTYQQLFVEDEVATDEKNEPTEMNVTEGQHDELLRSYFAADQSEKLMYQTEKGYFTVETFWLTKHYIKEIARYETSTEATYYRIANNKIEIVKVADGDAHYSLDELDQLKPTTVLVQAPFQVGASQGEWVVKETGKRWGLHKNVLVLERNEAGAITTMKLAPDYGYVYIEGNENGASIFEVTLLQLNTSIENKEIQFNKLVDTALELPEETKWQTSPMGKYRATLYGRDEFESVGQIYIEEIEYNYQTAFVLTNVDYMQITPKKIAWIDENRLFVIIGMTHGTITRGGKLYILDLKKNELIPLIEELPERAEISNIVRIDEENFEYELFTYLSDYFEEAESEITTGKIMIQEGFVYEINGDEVEYNSGNKRENSTAKVNLTTNKDARAIQLKDIRDGDLIEFIMLDGVIVQLNKVDYSP